MITIVILKIFSDTLGLHSRVLICLKNNIFITILKIFFRHSWAPIVSIWLENWISRTFIVSRGARLLQKFNLKAPFFQLRMIPKSKCDQRSMLFYLFFTFCIWPSKHWPYNRRHHYENHLVNPDNRKQSLMVERRTTWFPANTIIIIHYYNHYLDDHYHNYHQKSW